VFGCIKTSQRASDRVADKDEADVVQTAAEFVLGYLGEELVKVSDDCTGIMPIRRVRDVGWVCVRFALAVAVITEDGGNRLAGVATDADEVVHSLSP
jgi:hypothetical protein